MPKENRLACTTAVLLMAGALGACTSSPPSTPGPAALNAGRQCFYADNVTGFTTLSDRIVNVSVGSRQVYQFELFGNCPNVDWAQRIAIVSRGSSWICSGLDATVIAPSPIGPQRCPVRTVRKLSEAELAALPAKDRP